MLNVLDRYNVSHRKAVALVISTLGNEARDYSISNSMLRRARMVNRSTIANLIQSDFRTNTSETESLILHWDSKIMPDLAGNEKVDRLVILVSGMDIELV